MQQHQIDPGGSVFAMTFLLASAPRSTLLRHSACPRSGADARAPRSVAPSAPKRHLRELSLLYKTAFVFRIKEYPKMFSHAARVVANVRELHARMRRLAFAAVVSFPVERV